MKEDGSQPDPDIVLLVLQRVRARMPALSAEEALLIEQELRAEFGGLRVRIPKRGKHLTLEQRWELFKDGVSGMPTPEVVDKHKISRATMYRRLKQGEGRFSDE